MSTIARAIKSAPSTATHPDRQHLAQLARRLGDLELNTGARASLRRGNPTTVLHQPALHRLLVRLDEAALAGDGALRWATVVHALAIAVRPGSPASTRDAGEALAAAGYTESRMARLLATRGPAFRDQIVLLSRFLHAHDEPCSWLDLGELVLVEGRRERRAEQLRLRLARGYYHALDARVAE